DKVSDRQRGDHEDARVLAEQVEDRQPATDEGAENGEHEHAGAEARLVTDLSAAEQRSEHSGDGPEQRESATILPLQEGPISEKRWPDEKEESTQALVGLLGRYAPGAAGVAGRFERRQ